MKKLSVILLVAVLALVMATGGTAAGETLRDAVCAEEGFAIKVPDGMAAGYAADTGFQIFTEHEGYIPYVIVHRRTGEMRFKDPVNYLNNVYREHIEDKYGDDNLGMNTAKVMEIGGKELIGARYMFRVGDAKVVQLMLIEVRDAGDVEYTVKYLEGQDEITMAALDTAVRYYRETDDGTVTVGPEGKEVLKPADVTGTLVDRQSGFYWTRITDTEKIFDGGYFTAELYVSDLYLLDAVYALQSGDRVEINGNVWTVDTLLPEENGRRELRVREDFDGYIVFEKDSNTACTVLVNDWMPCTKIGEEKVMLPLANNFSFIWMGPDEDSNQYYKADAFLDLLTDGETARWLTQYNTLLRFSDGLVSLIAHWDYPEGPEAD